LLSSSKVCETKTRFVSLHMFMFICTHLITHLQHTAFDQSVQLKPNDTASLVLNSHNGDSQVTLNDTQITMKAPRTELNTDMLTVTDGDDTTTITPTTIQVSKSTTNTTKQKLTTKSNSKQTLNSTDNKPRGNKRSFNSHST
jgi:hypothetical protein